MSAGVFAVDRRIFEHGMFAPEPFTEREAWIWLFGMAAWSDCTARVGKAKVSLKRGQVAFALRFLAVKWQWSEPRVRRFLKRLQNDAMVFVQSTRSSTLVTICNYDKYAFKRRADVCENGAQNVTETSPERRKEEEDNNIINNSIGRADAPPPATKHSRRKPARPMPDIFPMSEKHREYAEKHGFKYEIPPSFTNFKARPGPAQQMFEAFKNHHMAKGSVFADWDAAWRTWVNNQVAFNAQKPTPRAGNL